MFENLYTVFRDVLILAQKRETLCNEVAKQSEDLIYDFEREKSEKEKLAQIAYNKLTEYLKTLDFESIKILQTIMYMGRDKNFDNITSKDERFKALYNSLNWVDKDIEIYQMASKVPMGSYLESGFRVLNINI